MELNSNTICTGGGYLAIFNLIILLLDDLKCFLGGASGFRRGSLF